MSCKKYLNRKTLIVGEVNSGKTERTLKILRKLMSCGEGLIAVLDLAPEKIQGVGGKLPLSCEERQQILYFSPRVVPPRRSGKNEEEIRAMAKGNFQRIEEILKKIQERAFRTLVINDVSLYLQTGRAEDLMSSLKRIPTIVMNGYYGKYFGASAFSREEQEQMKVLMSLCDQVVYLSPIISSSV